MWWPCDNPGKAGKVVHLIGVWDATLNVAMRALL